MLIIEIIGTDPNQPSLSAVREGLLNETGYEEAAELLGQPVPEIQRFVQSQNWPVPIDWNNPEHDKFVRRLGSIIDAVPDTQIPAASIPKLKNLANKNDEPILQAVTQISGKPNAGKRYVKLMKSRDRNENRNRGYSVNDLINSVKNGTYDSPVLLSLPEGVFVIGGRTRLYAALALNIPAKVKIISAETFTSIPPLLRESQLGAEKAKQIASRRADAMHAFNPPKEKSVADENLDEGIIDFISKAKDKFLRLKDALSDEWAQSKEMWRIVAKGNTANQKEINFANAQFKDILRVAGLSAWYSLPIPGNTLLILATEKLLNKVGMSIIPDKIRNQVLMSTKQGVAEGSKRPDFGAGIGDIHVVYMDGKPRRKFKREDDAIDYADDLYDRTGNETIEVQNSEGGVVYSFLDEQQGVAEGLDYEREPLYHATLKAFEPSIMKSGLLPGGNLRMFDWSDSKFVYLSNYPDIARDFIDPGVIEPDEEHEEQIFDLMKQGGVILKIDQNKLNRQLLSADPHFNTDADDGAETYIYSGVIPPSAIIGKQYFNINESKQGVAENFADGRNPGRKGLAKRSGVPTKASVSTLRKIAKNSKGERARMAHWLANMKSGKKHKK